MVTREEQKELEVRRREVVAQYIAGGFSQQEIADEHRVHKRTVQKWLKAHREDKRHGLDLIPHMNAQLQKFIPTVVLGVLLVLTVPALAIEKKIADCDVHWMENSKSQKGHMQVYFNDYGPNTSSVRFVVDLLNGQKGEFSEELRVSSLLLKSEMIVVPNHVAGFTDGNAEMIVDPIAVSLKRKTYGFSGVLRLNSLQVQLSCYDMR